MKKERSKKYRFIQSVRIFSQLFFFILFFYLLIGTRYPDGDYIGHVEIFFHFDPLLALTTFIASRTVFLTFIFAAITIVVTFFLGRVVCGWVCPLGSIHQFFSFVFKKTKLYHVKKTVSHLIIWKYYILVFILVATIFSLDVAGIFDPFSLLYRSFTVGIFPALSYSISSFIGILYHFNWIALGDNLAQFFENLDINSLFLQGFFIGTLFLGTLLLNLYRERFWCRYLCPLGALLGFISRWNILKLQIVPEKCIRCNLCTLQCQTQADPYPDKEWKSSECDYCFTCSAICPTDAVRFPLKATPTSIETVNFSRRKLIFTTLLGAFAVPFFRISPSTKRASERLIRPPGALPEVKFLQKCAKCGECMKVCPTNAIHPAFAEAGPEGIWTPMLVFKIGYCEYYCSLCTQVCPTGAIKELTIGEKNKLKIGTAWVDKNRCIPWKFGDPCIVCEEHCPISPKAIKFIKAEVQLPDDIVKAPLAPVVITETCTGCGICENKCPVVDAPAIYVTSVGESRSEKNQMLLDIIQPKEETQ